MGQDGQVLLLDWEDTELQHPHQLDLDRDCKFEKHAQQTTERYNEGATP